MNNINYFKNNNSVTTTVRKKELAEKLTLKVSKGLLTTKNMPVMNLRGVNDRSTRLPLALRNYKTTFSALPNFTINIRAVKASKKNKLYFASLVARLENTTTPISLHNNYFLHPLRLSYRRGKLFLYHSAESKSYLAIITSQLKISYIKLIYLQLFNEIPIY